MSPTGGYRRAVDGRKDFTASEPSQPLNRLCTRTVARSRLPANRSQKSHEGSSSAFDTVNGTPRPNSSQTAVRNLCIFSPEIDARNRPSAGGLRGDRGVAGDRFSHAGNVPRTARAWHIASRGSLGQVLCARPCLGTFPACEKRSPATPRSPQKPPAEGRFRTSIAGNHSIGSLPPLGRS